MHSYNLHFLFIMHCKLIVYKSCLMLNKLVYKIEFLDKPKIIVCYWF